MGQGASRRRRIKSTALFLYLLSMLSTANITGLFTSRVEGQRDIIVAIESPQEDKDYTVEQIIPIRVTVTDNDGQAITNATVEVTTKWDNQWVHVPLLEEVPKNGFKVAVYAPDPNYSVPQGQISEDTLAELNNNGFLRLPVSEGEWWLTLLVKPLSPNYLPYQKEVAVRIHTPGPPAILYVLAVGWASVIIIIVFLIKKRKKQDVRARQSKILKFAPMRAHTSIYVLSYRNSIEMDYGDMFGEPKMHACAATIC